MLLPSQPAEPTPWPYQLCLSLQWKTWGLLVSLSSLALALGFHSVGELSMLRVISCQLDTGPCQITGQGSTLAIYTPIIRSISHLRQQLLDTDQPTLWSISVGSHQPVQKFDAYWCHWEGCTCSKMLDAWHRCKKAPLLEQNALELAWSLEPLS